jgi:hypothetical protein
LTAVLILEGRRPWRRGLWRFGCGGRARGGLLANFCSYLYPRIYLVDSTWNKTEAYLDFASLQVRDYKSPDRMGELENVPQK